MATEKRKIGTIDLTPTWVSIVPVLEAALVDGTDEGKRLAKIELRRMAALADAYNATQKKRAA